MILAELLKNLEARPSPEEASTMALKFIMENPQKISIEDLERICMVGNFTPGVLSNVVDCTLENNLSIIINCDNLVRISRIFDERGLAQYADEESNRPTVLRDMKLLAAEQFIQHSPNFTLSHLYETTEALIVDEKRDLHKVLTTCFEQYGQFIEERKRVYDEESTEDEESVEEEITENKVSVETVIELLRMYRNGDRKQKAALCLLEVLFKADANMKIDRDLIEALLRESARLEKTLPSDMIRYLLKSVNRLTNEAYIYLLQEVKGMNSIVAPRVVHSQASIQPIIMSKEELHKTLRKFFSNNITRNISIEWFKEKVLPLFDPKVIGLRDDNGKADAITLFISSQSIPYITGDVIRSLLLPEIIFRERSAVDNVAEILYTGLRDDTSIEDASMILRELYLPESEIKTAAVISLAKKLLISQPIVDDVTGEEVIESSDSAESIEKIEQIVMRAMPSVEEREQFLSEFNKLEEIELDKRMLITSRIRQLAHNATRQNMRRIFTTDSGVVAAPAVNSGEIIVQNVPKETLVVRGSAAKLDSDSPLQKS